VSIAETITAVFKTNYQVDFPYDPQELFIYALIGYDSITLVQSSLFYDVVAWNIFWTAAKSRPISQRIPDLFQLKMPRAFT
jgi:hypothetical protein